MEESTNSASRNMSLLDSSGPNVTDPINNACDSNKTVSKTNSMNCDAKNYVLDNSTSNSNLSDNNCNVQLELMNNGCDTKSSSIQKAQFVEKVISNDQMESEVSSVGDENDLNLPGNVKNINCRGEQSAIPKNSAVIKEKQSDLVNNTCKILEISSEQALTKLGATNPEECSSGNIDNVNVTAASSNGIVKQSVNEEESDGSVTKHVIYSNELEAMVTEDHVECSEKGTEKSVIENTVPDNNSNNIPTCNEDKGKCKDQEVVEAKETNGNLHSSTDSSEPMVTDDSLEKGKVINETLSDAENNTDMSNGMEGIRNASVVEAMNKDQSWKADKVYKKDLRSLQLLCDYGSDSGGDDNEEMSEETNASNKTVASSVPAVNPCPAVNQEYREPEVVAVSDSEESDSSDETSSTSSATTSSSSDESEEEEESGEEECVIVEEKKKEEIPKTKGELGLEDLPPIEDLHITVPESECVEIGKVLSIVDSLVVVQSIKGCPALDLDSVLFLDHGHNALGEVFDVFGKVGEACYCVRFNSKEHALEKGVEVGMPVYYAPKTEYSKYVFLSDLTKMKGSDASWAHNNEPPNRFLDYSDDEEERQAKKGKKPPVRNVEREETQPQAKRFYWRGPNRGGGNRPTSPRSNPFWGTPFNSYNSDVPSSPPRSPSPSLGPKPLIRPSTFRNSGPPPPHGCDTERSFRGPLHPVGPAFQPPMQGPPYRNAGPPQSQFHDSSPVGGPAHRYPPQSSFMHAPPQSHFHNAAAGAPPMSGMPPPQFGRQDFRFDANVPPPQPPYGHNQMGSSSTNMNESGFRQGPPPTNVMRPTSIPNPGLFAVEPNNGFKVEAPASFALNQPPPMRQDFHGSYGGGPPSLFGAQQPVFMNPNVPPPPPATHQSPPGRHPHTGW